MGRHKAKWRVWKDGNSWVAEHPLFGRHASMGSQPRAFERAFRAAVKQMEGR